LSVRIIAYIRALPAILSAGSKSILAAEDAAILKSLGPVNLFIMNPASTVALKRESQIKSWPRKRKIELIGKKSLKRIRYNINGK
jgi:hypothetical protein